MWFSVAFVTVPLWDGQDISWLVAVFLASTVWAALTISAGIDDPAAQAPGYLF
jgi:hypothetical protein